MERSERRRLPRVPLSEDEYCELHLVVPVQLLDISMNGALLKTDTEFPVGTEGQLRFGLGGAAFAPTVEVRRCGSVAPAGGCGTVFTAMDVASRRRLEEFLKKASS